MTENEKHENRGRKWKRPGCIALAFYAFLIPYLINAAIVLIPAVIHAVKWQSHHIDSYEISVHRSNTFLGNNRTVVSDGEIIETEYCFEGFGEDSECSAQNSKPIVPEQANHNTVEALFSSIRDCAWGFPLYVCRGIEYDSVYDYPKSGIWVFTLHAHGSYSIEVLSFEPFPWPTKIERRG
jgi:hypothetical protein